LSNTLPAIKREAPMEIAARAVIFVRKPDRSFGRVSARAHSAKKLPDFTGALTGL